MIYLPPDWGPNYPEPKLLLFNPIYIPGHSELEWEFWFVIWLGWNTAHIYDSYIPLDFLSIKDQNKFWRPNSKSKTQNFKLQFFRWFGSFGGNQKQPDFHQKKTWTTISQLSPVCIGHGPKIHPKVHGIRTLSEDLTSCGLLTFLTQQNPNLQPEADRNLEYLGSTLSTHLPPCVCILCSTSL